MAYSRQMGMSVSVSTGSQCVIPLRNRHACVVVVVQKNFCKNPITIVHNERSVTSRYTFVMVEMTPPGSGNKNNHSILSHARTHAHTHMCYYLYIAEHCN